MNILNEIWLRITTFFDSVRMIRKYGVEKTHEIVEQQAYDLRCKLTSLKLKMKELESKKDADDVVYKKLLREIQDTLKEIKEMEDKI